MLGSMSRFARPTHALSKKLDNLIKALALDFVFYNFWRMHKNCACRLLWRPASPIAFGSMMIVGAAFRNRTGVDGT